jgi:VanZ family protein
MYDLPALLYIGLVFVGGSLPTQPKIGLAHSDKALHLVVFGGLALVLFRAIRHERREMRLGQQLWMAALGASLVGALLEVYQLALPYRSGEVLDWVSDTIGAALAALGVAILARHRAVDQQRSGG